MSKKILAAILTVTAVLSLTVNVYAAPHAVTPQTLAASDKVHKYYTGIPAGDVNLSEQAVQTIAGTILADPSYATDVQKVAAAAGMVAAISSQSMYGQDVSKYYRSPAGLTVAGVYTCAGSTRTLGRILDYMGYDWVHVNENRNAHQWCVMNVDGQPGFADGMGGFAGYGAYPPSGTTLPDGRVIVY